MSPGGPDGALTATGGCPCPLPPGRPRDWYVTHNRRLKAMRLAIALLDSGVYVPNQARNETIRSTAELIGVHAPSDTTCHMVRALMRYSR